MKNLILISFLLCSLTGKATNPVLPDSLMETKTAFSNYVDFLYLQIDDTTLNKLALEDGLKGYFYLKSENKLNDTSVLTIVDFTKSANEDRLICINPIEGKLLWKSVVSHGEKSGGLYPYKFSNKTDSHQSSIGFFVTGQRWNDHRLGECLQLYGKEYSNYKALTRGIIVHAADYATCEFMDTYGELGRSYGCPAVPHDGYEEFLDLIDNQSCYYIYHKDWRYHHYSKILNRKNFLIEFGRDFGLLL